MHLRHAEFSEPLFRDEEKILVERAKKAFELLDSILTIERKSNRITQTLEAVVYPNPLRVDIRAFSTNHIGQAFLAPECGFPVTEQIFTGDEFTPEFIAKLDDCIREYREYMEE